jgi:hypothetical protein
VVLLTPNNRSTKAFASPAVPLISLRSRYARGKPCGKTGTASRVKRESWTVPYGFGDKDLTDQRPPERGGAVRRPSPFRRRSKSSLTVRLGHHSSSKRMFEKSQAGASRLKHEALCSDFDPASRGSLHQRYWVILALSADYDQAKRSFSLGQSEERPVILNLRCRRLRIFKRRTLPRRSVGAGRLSRRRYSCARAGFDDRW